MIDFKEYLYKQKGFKKLTEEKRVAININVNEKVNKGDYNFENFKFVKQNGKSTIILEDFSPEKTVCKYVSDRINKAFEINFPNRNVIMEKIYNSLSILKNLHDFTIVRFDFKSYFSSIFTTYAYEYLKRSDKLSSFELNFFNKFTSKFDYLPIGIDLSNTIAELFGKNFDDNIISLFGRDNIIYYNRYIDDGFLLVKNYLSEKVIMENISKALKLSFHDSTLYSSKKNRVRLNQNDSKFNIIHKRHLEENSQTFTFLGYKFELISRNGTRRKSVEIKYGICDKKIEKMKTKYKKILISTRVNQDALRLLVYNHSRRVVYRTGSEKEGIWINKGISYNYGLLPYYLDHDNEVNSDLICPTTNEFLTNFFINLDKENDLNIGEILTQKKYSIKYSIATNRAIIYHQTIGMSRDDLIRNMKTFEFGFSTSLLNSTNYLTFTSGYNKLLSEYLITLKLGY